MSSDYDRQSKEIWSIIQHREKMEEEEEQRKAEQSLKDEEERKIHETEPYRFDSLVLDWNSDGTLNTVTTSRSNKRLMKFHCIWNADGSLFQVIRE